ncbi:MAG: LPS export ABC transporter permease LptF [bacterium]
MKIIDRYFIRELVPPLGLGLSAFTFVLLMGKILRLMEIIVANRIPVKAVGLIVLYLLPSLFIFVIPMSFLFAILILFGRLSADNEIMALRAAGISLYRIMAPVFVTSVFLFAATLCISCYITPRGNAALQNLILEATWKHATLGLTEKTFNDTVEDMVIYADEISGSLLRRVMISDQRKKGEMVTVFAGSGEIIANNRLLKLILRLKNGTIHRSNPMNAREYQRLNFSTYDILLPGGDYPESRRDFRVMSIQELWKEIEKQKKAGRQPYRLMIEWHQKFSIPFACIVFAMIACPLGIQNRKGNRLSGFGLSLIIILGYYAFLGFGKTMAYGGWLPVWLSMWMPNILLWLTGMYYFKKLERW